MIGFVAWFLLSLFTVTSLFLYSKNPSLLAVVMMAFYCLVLFFVQDYAKTYVKYFFVLFAIVVGGISLYYLYEQNLVFASFFLGFLTGIIVLVPFRGLPFMEPWTRTEASFCIPYINLWVHHWLLGEIAIISMMLLFRVANVQSGIGVFSEEVIAFLFGFGTFWFVSQIPEILIDRTPFAKSLLRPAS